MARYGGEEFAIVHARGRPGEGAAVRRQAPAGSWRTTTSSSRSNKIPVTISIGVADMTGETTEPVQFIKAADAMLYKAKRDGRNRVIGA